MCIHQLDHSRIVGIVLLIGPMLCGCGGNTVPTERNHSENVAQAYEPDCESTCEQAQTRFSDNAPNLVVAVESDQAVAPSFDIRFEASGDYLECFKQACGAGLLPSVSGCYCAYHAWTSNNLVVFEDEIPVASKIINAPLPEELDECPRRTVVVTVRVDSRGKYSISDPEMVYTCQYSQLPAEPVRSDGGVEGGTFLP